MAQENQRACRLELEMVNAAIAEISGLDCGLQEKESIRQYLDGRKAVAVSAVQAAQEEVYQTTKLLLMVG